jgi:hypothetical protein
MPLFHGLQIQLGCQTKHLWEVGGPPSLPVSHAASSPQPAVGYILGHSWTEPLHADSADEVVQPTKLVYHTHPAGAHDYFLFVYDDEPAAGRHTLPCAECWMAMRRGTPCDRGVVGRGVIGWNTDGYQWNYICFHIFSRIRIRIQIRMFSNTNTDSCGLNTELIGHG